MMMDCPRCGFSQPKDRYCANCGLDVEHFRAKPKPLFLRILQNPNFHLSLIALLLVLVIGFLLLNRPEVLVRGATERFRGTPLSSKEAADPDAPSPQTLQATTAVQGAPAVAAAPAEPVAATTAAPRPQNEEKAAPAEPKKLDLGFWELQRELLVNTLAGAERLAEGNAGRAYLIRDGAKMLELIRASGRRLSLNRTVPLQTGSQILVVTPPTSQEPFQVGISIQLTKWENKEAQVRWDAQLVLSQPETPQEMANPNPTVKAAIETNLTGTSQLSQPGMVLILLEPNNRHPRDEYVTKAGEGPWSIFSSENFRSGLSEWVLLLQIK